ncbi:MAG: terminase large subunit [Rhizobiales bacterium]|nr:terminase large subunit [Hyphomicrobiales bacterium]
MTAYRFDERTAIVAERFFDRMLVHVEGPMAGRPFVLEPWQRHIVRELWGWKQADGARRYRKLYLEVPRGNGKSTFAAGLALLLLAVDGEQSSKVYSAAADKGQAAIVFETAEKMVNASPFLAPRIKPYRNRTMSYDDTGSKYVVLSSDAFTKHGLNPHGIIFDELHAQPNRELYDVLNTAMGKRRQPIMIMITTAGYDRNSICWEQHEYARQVRDGVIDDPTFLPAIWSSEDGDDWTDPAVWAKANPNYGVSVRESFLQQECATALASPAYQNTFRRLYLNQWTQQENRWLDMSAWGECMADMPDLAGRPCYGGLDLATTTDIAAFVLAFPPQADGEPYWLVPYFWIPGANMVERIRRDRVPYDAWARDGLLEATPGNVIDYATIERDIIALGDLYDIREIAFDRWGAAQISQNLTAAGFTMAQMGQGFASMAAPTKDLLRLVLSKQLAHDGNPILRWMADNMVVEQDAAGNVKPSKAKSREKIDGMVAAIMALDRASRNLGDSGRSVYEERGVLTI